jgi:hypothetical protein
MSRRARRIDQILGDSPVAAALFGRIAAGREAARAIAPICAEIAPDFDPLQPGTCDLRGRELRLWLHSGAQSTKLRQATPRLLATLQRQGFEVNEIKVRVQPRKLRESTRADAPISAGMTPKTVLVRAKQQPAYGNPLAFARKLALTLPDGSLRRAAQALGRAMDARLARMRELNQPFDEQNRKKDNAGSQPDQEQAAGPGQIARAPANEIEHGADDDARTERKQ